MSKSFNIETDVTLECPRCRVYKTVERTAELPAEVRLIEIICPDCDDGDFHPERWFSAPGVTVSQDDRVYDTWDDGTPITAKHRSDGKAFADGINAAIARRKLVT